MRRSLHPIRQNFDVEKAGFHAFRRFRIAKVKTHYDQAAAHPDDYKKPGTSLDRMALGFLIAKQPIIWHPSDMIEITVGGKDFLK